MDTRSTVVMEIRLRKVREWTDLHDRVQWIGFAASDTTDDKIIVSSRSTKQRAKDMALQGQEPEEIARTLSRPVRLIREWLEI